MNPWNVPAFSTMKVNWPLSFSRSVTCSVSMSRVMTSQGVARQSSGLRRWLNLGLEKNSDWARDLEGGDGHIN